MILNYFHYAMAENIVEDIINDNFEHTEEMIINTDWRTTPCEGDQPRNWKKKKKGIGVLRNEFFKTSWNQQLEISEWREEEEEKEE